jgi:hypothetical protein
MTFELVTVPILPLFLVTPQPHAVLCENDGFHLYLRHPDMSFKNLNSSTLQPVSLFLSTLHARPACRVHRRTFVPFVAAHAASPA